MAGRDQQEPPAVDHSEDHAVGLASSLAVKHKRSVDQIESAMECASYRAGDTVDGCVDDGRGE